MISLILGMDLVTEYNYYNDRPFLYTFSVLNRKISALVILEENHIAALLAQAQDFSWVRGAHFSVHNYYLNIL